MTTVFDIDGTLILNDLPDPNWNDPKSLHPTTGECVFGDMPEYFGHNYINPELRNEDLSKIKICMTGRPVYRRKATRQELKKYGINPETLYMFSDTLYAHDKCLKWKYTSLLYLRPKYYVDNDAELCQELQTLIDEVHYDIKCISLKEWQKMEG